MSITRKVNRSIRRRIIRAVDLFCGAGGFDSGFVRLLAALGIEWSLKAVNHWSRALETHQLNHPTAERYLQDIHALTEFDIQRIVWGAPNKKGKRRRPWLDLLTASPTCITFSQARGDLPITDQQRMDPWAIINWITALHGRVRRVLVENVPGFERWGPLNEKGRPIKGAEGMHFRAWVATLESLGYKVEWRVIVCADHGDATTRERFFLQARRIGMPPIKWPEASHQAPGTRDVLSLFGDNDRPSWRTAADDVIDWSDLGTSIITRPRSLKPNTVNRVGTGAVRFGGAYAPVLDAVMGEVRYRARLEEHWTAPVSLAELGDPAKNPATGYTATQLLRMARTGKLRTTGKKPQAGAKAAKVKTRRLHLPEPADPVLRQGWRAAREAYAEAGSRHPARELVFQTRKRGEVAEIVRVGEEARGGGQLQGHHLLDPSSPYLVTMWGTGGGRSIDNPAPGFSAQGGHLALAVPSFQPVPFMFPANQGHGRTRGLRSVLHPVPAILTTESLALATPLLGPQAFTCANRMNNAARSVAEPITGITTTTGGGVFFGVPVLLGQHGGATARPWTEPVPTIAGAGAISVSFPVAHPAHHLHQPDPFLAVLKKCSVYADVHGPVPSVTTMRHLALAQPFLSIMKTRSAYADVRNPMPAATTRQHLALAVPYMLAVNHQGEPRFYGSGHPIPTVTSKQGIGLAIPSATWLQPYYSGYNDRADGGAVSTAQPVPAVTTKARFGLGSWDAWQVQGLDPVPFLVPFFGERADQTPRSHSIFAPVPTATGQGAGGLVVPLVEPHGLDGAHPYLVGIDHASGGAYVRSVDQPVGAVVTKQSHALAVPEIHAADETGKAPSGRMVWLDDVALYIDVLFRMLSNRELSRAMSFDDEEYEYQFAGTQEEITRQIGNAVPVRTARALCAAALYDVLEEYEADPMPEPVAATA